MEYELQRRALKLIKEQHKALTQQTEYNNQQRHTHHPTRFFLVVSLFIIAMSILAVYSTMPLYT